MREQGRDGKRVYHNESVEIFLAPDGTGQKWVQLIVNPVGKDSRWDARFGYIDDPLHPLVLAGRADKSWSPEYEYAFTMDPRAKKWTLEIAFPFRELEVKSPTQGTRWMGNFARGRYKYTWDSKKYSVGDKELHLWSANLQKAQFDDAAVFGDLYFASIPEER